MQSPLRQIKIYHDQQCRFIIKNGPSPVTRRTRQYRNSTPVYHLQQISYGYRSIFQISLAMNFRIQPKFTRLDVAQNFLKLQIKLYLKLPSTVPSKMRWLTKNYSRSKTVQAFITMDYLEEVTAIPCRQERILFSRPMRLFPVHMLRSPWRSAHQGWWHLEALVVQFPRLWPCCIKVEIIIIIIKGRKTITSESL